MVVRNIINPEAIDDYIVQSARCFTAPVDLALKALRRPMRAADELFTRVDHRPLDAPDWVTDAAISSGDLYRFDLGHCDIASCLNQTREIMGWLRRGCRPGRMTPHQARKWEARLGHIATLGEASALAERQLVAWRAADRKKIRAWRLAGRTYHPPSDLTVPQLIEVSATFSELIEGGEITHTANIGNGARWFELKTLQALALEGQEMDNCLSHSPTHAALLATCAARYFSLRGDDLSPRVTLMVLLSGEFEARRAENQPIRNDDLALIDRFLERIGVSNPVQLAGPLSLNESRANQRWICVRRSADQIKTDQQRINEVRMRDGLPPFKWGVSKQQRDDEAK